MKQTTRSKAVNFEAEERLSILLSKPSIGETSGANASGGYAQNRYNAL